MELEAQHQILGKWSFPSTGALHFRPLWTHHLHKPINLSKEHSIYPLKNTKEKCSFTCAVDLLSHLSREPNYHIHNVNVTFNVNKLLDRG